MKKRIVILGATGSIGENSLKVLGNLKDEYEIVGISGYSNYIRLLEIASGYNVDRICIANENIKNSFNEKDGKIYNVNVFFGMNGILNLIDETKPDVVLNSLVGSIGLKPSLKTIEVGADLALANKEALVVGGELITKEAERKGVKILPIDSEHSAVMQCIEGENKKNIKRVILTASGGPFLYKDITEFDNITVKDALNHPNWSMGKKITIDSATMMNKGLEVIEARWLFNIKPENIDIIIHPQSIIHSMVEFIDGSLKAQLGKPDMKIPIQYALTYPDRYNGEWATMDFNKYKQITFLEVDHERYPGVKLAYRSLKMGGTAPAVLNKSNEIAVEKFLTGEIKYPDIIRIIRDTLNDHQTIRNPELEDLMDAERRTEETVGKMKIFNS